MGVEEELVRLFEKANKAAENASSDGSSGGPEESRCVEAIRAMHSFPVTTALLISTQIYDMKPLKEDQALCNLQEKNIICTRFDYIIKDKAWRGKHNSNH